ncbi:hypothetical protein AB6A40_007312 [Gnathostoma spinigerum]|uniref:Uncharacterized protein n=1 Tax=Gnathostoma spinigerum TaxID=75299 RepID=A0ABD6EKU9_9BILA
MILCISQSLQARIKTGGAPHGEPLTVNVSDRLSTAVSNEGTTDIPVTIPAAISPSFSDTFDLGQILACCGYVPRATFKPGATVVHVTNTNGQSNVRPSGQRSRGAGHSSYYRGGGGSRGRGASSSAGGSREYSSHHREYGGTGYHGYYGGGRRGTVNHNNDGSTRDGYRDRNEVSSNRVRARSNRPNSFSYGAGNSRSRTPIEPQKLAVSSGLHSEMRQRQRRGLLNIELNGCLGEQTATTATAAATPSTTTASSSSTTTTITTTTTATLSNGRNRSSPIIRTPGDENKRVEHDCSSTITDGAKSSDSGTRKTDEMEYNFEEGAFPYLSDDIKVQPEVTETEKPTEKPSFSAVAAGRRREKKEPKERKSYAQTLKQNSWAENL